MLIRVTKADIDEGICGDCHGCPVALVIATTLKVETDKVIVTPHTIHVLDVAYRVPVRVQRFIRRFDGGLEVQPFAFQLRREPLRRAA
jgi:hypothetical protein